MADASCLLLSLCSSLSAPHPAGCCVLLHAACLVMPLLGVPLRRCFMVSAGVLAPRLHSFEGSCETPVGVDWHIMPLGIDLVRSAVHLLHRVYVREHILSGAGPSKADDDSLKLSGLILVDSYTPK